MPPRRAAGKRSVNSFARRGPGASEGHPACWPIRQTQTPPAAHGTVEGKRHSRHFDPHTDRGPGACPRIAGKTGVGYQTVLKRAIREGLKKAG
jgi:hypothetical protein